MRRLRRKRQGNAIAEFGPAIFILLIMILIPMMVLVYVGLGFACGWYLNYMSVRSAAVVNKNAMQTACDNQTAAWYQSGLPAFTGASVVSNTPNRTVTNATSGQGYCDVTTVITINPFVSIPMVPLGPWTFTYKGERPIEEYSLE